MLDRLREFYARLSPWTRDTAERAVSTAVQAFLASVPLSAIVASVEEKDFDGLWTLVFAGATAALAAALSVIKSRLAKRFGYPDSASLDPEI